MRSRLASIDAVSLLALAAVVCTGLGPGCRTADRRVLDLRERDNAELRVELKEREVSISSALGTLERLRGELRAVEEERAGLAEKYGRADASRRILQEKYETLDRVRMEQDEKLRRAEQALEDHARLRLYVAAEIARVVRQLDSARRLGVPGPGEDPETVAGNATSTERIPRLLLILADSRVRLHEVQALLRSDGLGSEVPEQIVEPGRDGTSHPGPVQEAHPLPLTGGGSPGLPPHLEQAALEGAGGSSADREDTERVAKSREPSFWAEFSGLVKTRFRRLFSSDSKWGASDLGFLGALLILLGLVLFAASVPLRILMRRRQARALAALEDIDSIEDIEDLEDLEESEERSEDPEEELSSEEEEEEEEGEEEEEPAPCEDRSPMADPTPGSPPREAVSVPSADPVTQTGDPEEADAIAFNETVRDIAVQDIQLPAWLGPETEIRSEIAAEASPPPEIQHPGSEQSRMPEPPPAPAKAAPASSTRQEPTVEDAAETQHMPDLSAPAAPFGHLRLRLSSAIRKQRKEDSKDEDRDAQAGTKQTEKQETPEAGETQPLGEEHPATPPPVARELAGTDVLPDLSAPLQVEAPSPQPGPGPSSTQAMPAPVADEFTQTQPMPDLVPQDALAAITNSLGVPLEGTTGKADPEDASRRKPAPPEEASPSSGAEAPELAQTQQIPEGKVPAPQPEVVKRADLSPLEKLLRVAPEERTRTQRIPRRRRRRSRETREMARPAGEELTPTQPLPKVKSKPAQEERAQVPPRSPPSRPTGSVHGVVLQEHSGRPQGIPHPVNEGLQGTETIPDVTLEDLRNTEELPTLGAPLLPPASSPPESTEAKPKPTREQRLLAELEDLLGRKLDEPAR